MAEKIITESAIKAMSLKFVKERFGFHNLKAGEGSGIDLVDHRRSFEAAVSIILPKLGYTKQDNFFVLDKEPTSEILNPDEF